MTTITRISTNHESRLHVEEDTDATCDCFLVTLSPYVAEPGLLVYSAGVGMDVLWADALATVTHLRAQPWKAIHPPHVFQPWATITARNYLDVARDAELHMQILLGQQHPDHMERVQRLIRAHELLSDAPLPATVPWPNLKALN